MQTRAVRLTIFALLVITTAAAAFVAWDAHARVGIARASEREVDGRVDRMREATAALGAAQQAYVAPGQQRGDAMTRASVLVQQIYDDIPSLRRVARTAETGRALLAFGQSMDALVNVDDRVRDHLRLDQQLMAADLVYTEARQAIEAMTAQLDVLRDAERRLADAERAAMTARETSAAGAGALIGLIGALVLVRNPAPRAAVPRDEALEEASTTELVATASPVDLAAAAQVCSELSRMADASSLAATLARAARVLDASGLVVWLGAGDELFPAVGHGYGPLSLARLGPIARAAGNATAAAWRSGEMAIVPGSPAANGAVVAPLHSQSGCVGVLAAEVRHGREHDRSTQAVASMIAAQLAAVVAPWPAGSEEQPAADDPSRSASGSDGAPAAERTAASA